MGPVQILHSAIITGTRRTQALASRSQNTVQQELGTGQAFMLKPKVKETPSNLNIASSSLSPGGRLHRNAHNLDNTSLTL